MPNVTLNKGKRQGRIPINVSSPFPLKIGDKKPLLYSFGKLAVMVPKVTSTSSKISPFGNFGKLSRLGGYGKVKTVLQLVKGPLI